MLNRWSWISGGLVLFLWTAGAAVFGQIQFTDVSEPAGIDLYTYSSGGGHGLGVNWIDYDADGWPDLFVVGGLPSHPPRLFHNNGDGTFTPAGQLLPEPASVEMSGSRFADIDNDGDVDLFIYTDNEEFLVTAENQRDGPPNLLLRNLWVENGRRVVSGEPLFVEIAAQAGVSDLAAVPFGDLPAYRSKTASFFDYDRDGCIDLYVGHLVLNDGGHPSNRDRLYRNRCDGTFEDATDTSGLYAEEEPSSYRAALAGGGFHLDDDLWPDLYVVNVSYGDPQPYLNEQIYRNNGDGTFTEVGSGMPGVGDDAQAGMGVDTADVDLDGDWDVYISDLWNTVLDEDPQGNVFYLNDGSGSFGDNVAELAGVQGNDSWGVNFFDADLDGLEDLYVATGIQAGEILYRNDGAVGEMPTFTNVAESAGLRTGNSRGSALADYDRDGDLDLAVINQDSAAQELDLQLFRNDSTVSGHWLILELEGGAGNRDAIGTLVEATTGGESPVVRRRQVKGGSSAHSQDALAVHFGLGNASTVDTLRICWPSGTETVLTNVAVDRYLKVSEAFFQDGFESGDTTAWQ